MRPLEFIEFLMGLAAGVHLGVYEILSLVGAGGPALARGVEPRELRRGLAVAKEART
jgi:hypothetical protein